MVKMIFVVDGRSSLIQIELSAKMSLDSNWIERIEMY